MQERIKKIWDAKLEVTEKIKGKSGLLHIIRLSWRPKLSEKETLVMIYTPTCQIAELKGAGGGGMRYMSYTDALISVLNKTVWVFLLPKPNHAFSSKFCHWVKF